jgi:outer membrane protein OmpA-like peptidoglycan-associated protein
MKSMASKSYTLALGFLTLASTAVMGQRNDVSTDWWKDSSKVATRNLPQFNEFRNNQYPFPARPRDQWELGFHGGLSYIYGDVDPVGGFSGGFSLRKAIGHVVSVRADYTGGFNYGLDIKPRTTAPATPNGGNPWVAYNNRPGGYFANYRNAYHQGNLDVIFSLNTLSHYRGNPKFNVYLFGGYSLLAADVDVDARQDNGTLHNFAGVNTTGSRRDIRRSVKDRIDGNYESNGAVTQGSRKQIGLLGGNILLRHAASLGGGISWRLSKKLSLGIEQRFTFSFDDDMDGVAEGGTSDIFAYTAVRGGITLGNRERRVDPLWWINPYNFVYSELNSPKHMKLPTPILPDADGDGVTDQFDLEPSTPAGAPVDTKGVSKDTDGDGVPDFRDKELLTSQKCFPVNADGVGNCPEPPCCTELRDKIGKGSSQGDCGVSSLPSVAFKAGAVKISKDIETLLKSVAQQLIANPSCKVRVIGYGATSKSAQQLSWDRVNAVIKYLVEKQGISESRFIFSYGQDGDANTVDLQPTTEEGPNTVPAPHPNLKKTK